MITRGNGPSRLWEVTTGKPVGPALPKSDFDGLQGYSPNGTYALELVGDPKKPKRKETLKSVRHTGKFDADGRAVVIPESYSFEVEDSSSVVRLLDPLTSKPRGPDLVHPGAVQKVGFSPDVGRLFSICEGVGRLWAPRTGQTVGEPLKHGDAIELAEFSADGSRLYTISETAIRVWEASSGISTGATYPAPPELGGATATRSNKRLSLDLSRLLLLKEEDTGVWDLKAGKLLSTLDHKDQTVDVQFSADGSMVVMAGMRGSACIWDVESGRLRATSFMHAHQVSSAKFSRDGAWRLTSCLNQSARLWPMCSLLNPPLPVPRWFLDYARAIAGIRSTPGGQMETFPEKERLEVIHTPHPGDDAWSVLTRWLAQPSRERKFMPESSFTCRELAERERDFGSIASLQSSVYYDPSVPLARLLLAGAYEAEDRPGKSGAASAEQRTMLRELDLALLPADATPWERAARALHAQKQPALTQRALKKLTELAPERAAKLGPELVERR